uniref:Photosystem I assembly protein Ycf4 n=1 Tax=Rhodogorgon sp. TaxID=2485824 RepID=A0A3G3MI61_9FLOR|nr:photosystem I assembly protein Ycf4 [Rhodogorgon sp.]
MKTDYILGSRRLSNYWWATIIFLGGCGFLLAGLSSYLNVGLLPFVKLSGIAFIPQGMIMIFYGTIAIGLSSFLWLTIIWDIGGGYNQYNNNNGIITVFRFGFPGRNRKICLKYKMKDIQSVRVDIRNSLNPKREIYLKTKDNREIPLTRVGEPLLLSEVEEQATELAKFLNVTLEGID